MDRSRRLLIGSVIAIGIVLALFAVTWSGLGIQDDRDKDYKKISSNIDKSIQSLRLGKDPSSYLQTAFRSYTSLVEGENFENNSQPDKLDEEIKNSFSSLLGGGGGVKEADVQELNKKITLMAGELDASSPIAFKYSSLIILGFSISLALIANVLCQRLVDWKQVEKLKENISDWRKKFQQSRMKKGKKKKKLELEDKDYRKAQKEIWGISIKQAVFYLTFFVLFFGWLALVYGDWIVVWLPFDWSWLTQFVGVSFGYRGWFFLSYFGFSYFWRELIITEG